MLSIYRSPCSQTLLIHVFHINFTGPVHTWPLLLLLAFFHLQFPWITALFFFPISSSGKKKKKHADQPSSPFHTGVIGSPVGRPGVRSKQLWRKEVRLRVAGGPKGENKHGNQPFITGCGHRRHLMAWPIENTKGSSRTKTSKELGSFFKSRYH